MHFKIKCRIQMHAEVLAIDLFGLQVLFSQQRSQRNLTLCLFIIYTQICTCIRRNLKETVLQGIITRPVLRKKKTQKPKRSIITCSGVDTRPIDRELGLPVPTSITSDFSFFRLKMSSLSRNQLDSLSKSQERLPYIASISPRPEDKKITVSSAQLIILQ